MLILMLLAKEILKKHKKKLSFTVIDFGGEEEKEAKAESMVEELKKRVKAEMRK